MDVAQLSSKGSFFPQSNLADLRCSPGYEIDSRAAIQAGWCSKRRPEAENSAPVSKINTLERAQRLELMSNMKMAKPTTLCAAHPVENSTFVTFNERTRSQNLASFSVAVVVDARLLFAFAITDMLEDLPWRCS